jgi:hypothetical protein
MADASGNAQAGAARESVLKSLSTTDLTTAQKLYKTYTVRYGHASDNH